MIGRDEMLPLLVEACPSFAPTWKAFVEEWREEPEAPLYLALGELARHLASQLAIGETAEFSAVFKTIERLHIEGEHYVKEAATVGLLEDLQSENIHKDTKPEQFRQYLRPETERWWDKLHAFWRDGKLLTDD